MQAIYLENLNTGAVLKQEGLDLVFHPASLLKLFTAIAVRDLIMQVGGCKPTCTVLVTAAQRAHLAQHKATVLTALEASLAGSDNDALHYLVDFISETQSGLELEGVALDAFIHGRYLIHSFFTVGYSEYLRISNKCFEVDYYGRDKQVLAQQPNQCTIEDVAQVMKVVMATHGTEIDLAEMIKRKLSTGDYQADNFIGAALGLSNEFYSKAGWTSCSYHDACVFERDGEQQLMVIMTGFADSFYLARIANQQFNR